MPRDTLTQTGGRPPKALSLSSERYL